ncbi:mitochondrial fission protein ELM1-like protein [Cladochytrium replicatum]|nr:mitochondrial fission protein ELM1-like protein [Cladochytrium replicatum]
MVQSLSAWIFSAGSIGRDRQAIALANTMGIHHELKHIVPSAAVRWLAPRMQRGLIERNWDSKEASKGRSLPWYLSALNPETKLAASSILPPFPNIVISTCDQTVLGSLHVKECSHGDSFALHLGMPAISPDNFDALVVPQHDWVNGMGAFRTPKVSKVIPIELPLTSIDRPQLDSTAKDASQKFNIPAKVCDGPQYLVLAVLIGAPTRHFRWSSEDVGRFLKQLERAVKLHQHKVLLTFSHRTTPPLRDLITNGLTKLGLDHRSDVFIWDGQGANPYEAFLGLADAIAVTADSVMMTAESVHAKKPVYVIGYNCVSGPLHTFHRRLMTRGYTRMFVPSRRPALVQETPRSTLEESVVQERDVLSDVGLHDPWSMWSDDEKTFVADRVWRLLNQEL